MSFRLEFAAADHAGLSDLALRALADRPRPNLFGGELPLPAHLEDLTPPANLEARFVPEERDELAANLERRLTPLAPHVRVLDAVRSLREPGATMVVAGQQPGLFGGPLFNLYKAVHVIRLARDLADRWGTPVVPVLWNHADDHDLAEAHHVHLATPQLDLAKVVLPGASSGRTPLGRYVLDDERHQLAALRQRVTDLLGGEPFRDTAVDLCLPRHGETLARAWTRLFLELFGHHGLVVLEPDMVRANLSHALADLLTDDPHPHLAANRSRLAERQVDVPIDPDTAALVYHIEQDERHALRHGGDGFRLDDEPGSRRASELAAEVVGDLHGYSAGALLRPLVQDLALPVAAYVGGWGELAYHAQLTEWRAASDLPRTPFVPRLACTLTDARCRASLRRLDVDVPGFVAARRDPEATDPWSDREREPSAGLDLAADLAAEADAFRTRLRERRDAVKDLDHALVSQLERCADQVKKHVVRFADKVERVATNQKGGARRHLRRLDAWLWPRGGAQERSHSILQWLARFDRGWLDDLVEAIEPLPLEHHLVHLETPAGREQR